MSIIHIPRSISAVKYLQDGYTNNQINCMPIDNNCDTNYFLIKTQAKEHITN